MFEARIDIPGDGEVRRYRIIDGTRCVTYGEVLELWRRDPGFRSFFIALLSEAPFTAFRWETPLVTSGTLDRSFEFVLLDSPGLAVPADATAFAAHLDGADDDDGIVVFPNLGADAVLVVPLPRGPVSAYAHIAAFSRAAPADQQHALWQAVGEVMGERTGGRPVWLSTAGGAVPWLHIRLDSRPKYYGFLAYRAAP